MKKLLKIKNWVKTLKDLKELNSNGFKKVRTLSSSGRIWVNREKKIVVKTPFLVGNKPRKHAVPTVRFSHFNGILIFVQPLVNTKKKYDAEAELEGLKSCLFNDLHGGNVGYYKGKPVVFDW